MIDNLHSRSLFGSVLGSVQSSGLGVYYQVHAGSYLGTYSQAGWECAIECNRELTWEHTVLQVRSVQLSAIGTYPRAYPGAYLRAYLRACLGASSEVRLEV